VTALVFPDLDACRKLVLDLPADTSPAALLADPRVTTEFRRRLGALAATSRGSSTQVCRITLLATPPSLDIGEMTDKGSINQRAVLANRAGLVEELYAAVPPRHIIVATSPQAANAS
jgi:feruloyl-CoA synthase